MTTPYPQPPPPGFRDQYLPPYSQGDPMLTHLGMQPPPAYSNPGYAYQPPPQCPHPMGMGGPTPTMVPGPGYGGYPQTFYPQHPQGPTTAYSMDGAVFYSIPISDAGPRMGDLDPTDPEDKTARRAFLRNVYTIMCVQLLVIVGFVALFLYHQDLRMWVRNNPGILAVAMVITLIPILSLTFCPGVRRKSPQHFVCLVAFSLAEGFVVGCAAATYNQTTFLLVTAVTAAVFGGLSILASFTKLNYTAHSDALLATVIVGSIFGIFMITLRGIFPILHLIYSCGGALLFSLLVVYGTHSGKFLCFGNTNRSLP